MDRAGLRTRVRRVGVIAGTVASAALVVIRAWQGDWVGAAFFAVIAVALFGSDVRNDRAREASDYPSGDERPPTT